MTTFKERWLTAYNAAMEKGMEKTGGTVDVQPTAAEPIIVNELVSEQIRLYIEQNYTDQQQAAWLESTEFDEQMAELLNTTMDGVTDVVNAALGSVKQFFAKLG